MEEAVRHRACKCNYLWWFLVCYLQSF